jgi:hypothetical protein
MKVSTGRYEQSGEKVMQSMSVGMNHRKDLKKEKVHDAVEGRAVTTL